MDQVTKMKNVHPAVAAQPFWKDLTAQNESCERETAVPKYPSSSRSLVSAKVLLCPPTTPLLYRKDCPLFMCSTVDSVPHHRV